MANCLSFFGMVCLERENARIFQNKERSKEEVWDIFYFYTSLWAFCTKSFSGVPLSILLLNRQRFVFPNFSFGFVSFCTV